MFRMALVIIFLNIQFGVLSAEESSLPRVLFLGDRYYHVTAAEVAKQLKGKAEVVYIGTEPGEVRNSTFILENFDKLLGDKPWDLILFNTGLGDLIYRVPNMKAFRVLPMSSGGVRATSPEKYQSNLETLVKKLKATKAKLVWLSTTPIRNSTTEVFAMQSEIEYNKIAARIMKEHQVPTLDMYQYVYDLINMNKPASHNADPFTTDKKPIHEPIVKAIEKWLW